MHHHRYVERLVDLLDPALNRLHGVDLIEDRIDAAREALPAAHFTVGDAGALDFPDASFDLVTQFTAMSQVKDRAGLRATVAEIERVHHEMYRFYLRRDMHGYFQCNQEIHRMIVAAAGNATLAATYASFAGRIRRVRYSANLATDRDRWGEAMREHEAILDALRRRAGSELSDILFMHLRNKRKAAEQRSSDQLAEPESAA